MIEIAVATSLAATWLFKKASRVGKRVDGEVDHALDAALDKLSGVVDQALGTDRVLTQLRKEADEGLPQLKDRTQRQVEDALADVAEGDESFAAQLTAAVEAVQEAAQGRGSAKSAGAGGVAADQVNIRADQGSIAAAVITGGASIGTPPQPDSNKG
ncbi:hypothetical protein [Streptomyces aureus]|uniref:hypothetical protein n=1 Tax=Streptomyces aureus TaxID=193461 RepID=UPI00068B03EF|nr:hypothetical protein [Streptomyces aureus]